MPIGVAPAAATTGTKIGDDVEAVIGKVGEEVKGRLLSLKTTIASITRKALLLPAPVSPDGPMVHVMHQQYLLRTSSHPSACAVATMTGLDGSAAQSSSRFAPPSTTSALRFLFSENWADYSIVYTELLPRFRVQEARLSAMGAQVQRRAVAAVDEQLDRIQRLLVRSPDEGAVETWEEFGGPQSSLSTLGETVRLSTTTPTLRQLARRIKAIHEDIHSVRLRVREPAHAGGDVATVDAEVDAERHELRQLLLAAANGKVVRVE